MSDEAARWQRRLERERLARKEAERLLEEKSLALYHSNQELQQLAHSLDAQVRERTQALESALAQAQRATAAKGEFLAMMSHEIRTPMNGILGMVQLLELSRFDDEQREHLATIRRSGDALLVLINDILDFSKIEAGKLELEARPFDLRRELESIGALYRPLVEGKSLVFDVRLDEALPGLVRGDSTRLRQVVSNLLSNAIKFTTVGRITLAVQARIEDGMAHVQASIRDTGIGIPPERMDRLFKAFSQADASTTREYGGTGLGLAICARLCEMMGGAIGVESNIEGLERGSRFFFDIRLPVASDSSETVARPPAGDATDFTGLRVLVAEDNAVNTVLVMKLLEKLGVHADHVVNGRLAVHRIEQAEYDIVLMDMQMPEMDGLQATTAIRALPLPRQPRIVALTANAFESDRESCLAAGMNDFLSKPFRLDDLRARLAANLPEFPA